MEEFSHDIVLIRAPSLALRLGSDSRVEIGLEGRKIEAGPHGLAILDAFQQPRTVKVVLERLDALVSSAQDWIDLITCIKRFHRYGVLVEPSQTKPSVSEAYLEFDGASSHISMLDDQQRVRAYLDSISEVVQPGDVVVDIGTGTGILAMAAARAGAARVYALEVGRIAEVAQANFAANDLSDRITLVRGWSTQVSLPERADVLVSEIIGSEPLAERVLEATTDAVKRFLKPTARLIPSHIKMYVQFMTLPDEILAKYIFLDETLEKWRSWYGMNFSALREISTQQSFPVWFKPTKPREWMSLSESALAIDIDLRTYNKLYVDQSITVEVQTTGRLDGGLVFPDLDLSSTVVLSRAPTAVDDSNSWRTPFWVLPQPLEVQRGDCLKVSLQYAAGERRHNLEIARI